MKLRALLSASALALLALSACDKAPVTEAGPATVRRLTQEQYATVISDTFGTDIKIGGRFDPDIREEGLLAVGTSRVSVTPTSIEQYDSMARSIAAQVLDDRHRGQMLGCQPADAKAADDACTSKFLAEVGRQLFRRPVRDDELKAFVAVAADATRTLGDYYAGLETSLAVMLEAPDFLFRREVAVTGKDGTLQLDAYSKAARLSFFLWNTSPDDELLRAAEQGDLDNPKGLAAQVDRLLASPRLEGGVRAFFADFLRFDGLSGIAKDPQIYPKFTPLVAGQAREQTLRTVVDHLLVQKGDYRDLFTTRRTYLTQLLGAIYRVPVQPTQGWELHEFQAGDPRAGIATQVSFLAMNSHPGRSSPTLRGKAVREVLLCQPVPAPPNNVDFKLVQDTNNPNFRTARDRLTAHANAEVCAGCHKIVDPIGLALEKFDGMGEARKTENGAPINDAGEMNGAAFEGAVGLGQRLHDDPAAVSCVVGRLASFALGRPPVAGEAEWVQFLQKRFAGDNYRFPDLMRRIATSDAFYRVTKSEAPAEHAAAASTEEPKS